MAKLEPNEIYKSAIRTVCVIFASLFNDITVRTYTKEGEQSGEKKVNIVFSSKQAYHVYCEELMRLHNTPVVEIGRKFPVLTFDLMDIARDEQRQLMPYLYKTQVEQTPDGVYGNTAVSPAAYAFGLQLTLWAKDMDTSIQVLDQILPYFKPEVAIKIKEEERLPVANDVHVMFNGITRNDNYLDGLTENRIIQWDMNFTAFSNIWTPAKDGPVITKVITDIFME